MLTYLTTSIRALLLAAVLVATGPVAGAYTTGTDHSPVAARTMNAAHPEDRNDASLDGVLIIAGIVGAVILFAWVCSRVADTRRPTM